MRHAGRRRPDLRPTAPGHAAGKAATAPSRRSARTAARAAESDSGSPRARPRPPDGSTTSAALADRRRSSRTSLDHRSFLSKLRRGLFTRQPTLLARSRRGSSSKERVGSCYVPGAGVLEGRYARLGRRDRPLRRVGRAGEDLLVHPRRASFAQALEGGGVAAALGQAVAAVAQRVRTL